MEKNRSKIIKLVIFAAALCMCIYGALSGEARAVFIKAAKICMECIGLG